MDIKSIRMKYRQKALPDRSQRIGAANRALENVVRSHMEDLERMRVDLRPFQHFANGVYRAGVLLEDLRMSVQCAQAIWDLQRGSVNGPGDQYYWALQNAEQLLQIIDGQSWNDGTIVNIAKNILRTNDWDQCPILADALEDAGIYNDVILQGLREGSEIERRNYCLKIAGGYW